MVKMIPPSISSKESYGEREIFDSLRESAKGNNWVAIHGLTQHLNSSKYQAEGDFVVLIPGKGIVVIEVKGATAATLEGEVWTFEGVAPAAKHKSPLEQIGATQSNIKTRLRQNDVEVHQIPMARLVWFPKLQPWQFAEIQSRGLLIGQWELAFKPDLEDVVATIENSMDEYIAFSEGNSDLNFKPGFFDEALAKQVENILVVSASATSDPGSLSDIQGKEIGKATNSALELLDSVFDNENVYFEGPAGTGKSLMLGLAGVELANQGRKVLITCYNLMMADELKERYGKHPNIDVYPIHELFFNSIPQSTNKSNQTWFDVELPKLARAALAHNESLPRYDVICVDEFQDIASKPEVVSTIFSYFSPDSPFAPKALMAGDDWQNIYGAHEGKTSFEVAKQIFSDLMRVRLNKNCRQAPGLSDAVFKFLTLDKSKVNLKHLVPKDVEWQFEVIRPKVGEETKELATVTHELLKRYKPKQIRVLSPYGNKSLLGDLFTRESVNKDERWIKANFRHKNSNGEIPWRSIGKYKGLESDVVVITDIGASSKEWAESIGLYLEELLYVGMTRARFHLVLLVSDGLYAGKSA